LAEQDITKRTIQLQWRQKNNFFMILSELLNTLVSYQTTAYAPISKQVTLKSVLLEIAEEKYAFQIQHLRKELITGNIEKYNIHKKSLPGVTFSATFFEKRRKENLKTYNQIIVIDIDKLSESQIVTAKNNLLNDPYVFAFWTSPSKVGLKGLVYLNYESSFKIDQVDFYHKFAFKLLSEYFVTKYFLQLDENGSDTTRLCFYSSDNSLTLKESLVPFDVKKLDSPLENVNSPQKKEKTLRPPTKRSALLTPKGKNNPYDRLKMQSIIRYLNKKNLSITETYESWYRVAYAIANTFTHDIGEKYFLQLCKMDSVKYDEINSKNILLYCYENNDSKIKFNTLVYFANQKGYNIKIKREEGTEDGQL
jgi:hypothetical protein